MSAYEYRDVSEWHVTLACAAVQQNAAKVKVQYTNPNQPALMTVGTLHLTYGRLATLVRMLTRGGARLTLTGSYLASHPELRRVGQEVER